MQTMSPDHILAGDPSLVDHYIGCALQGVIAATVDCNDLTTSDQIARQAKADRIARLAMECAGALILARARAAARR